MFPPDTPTIIYQRLCAGERPSFVLRSLLASSTESTKNDLAHEMAAAFPNQDSWVLIYPVWHWKEREKSEAWDAIFDFRLILELIALGEPLPWTADDCQRELKRVQPAIDEFNRLASLKADEAASFATLDAKISTLPGKLACIEALWDGDTDGWFIRLSAIMQNDHAYDEHWLVCISKGNDTRLFNGQVPPWPEAVHAAEVGEKLARHRGAEFYFPSREEPNDNKPSWLQRVPDE
jgi:hypothetical protein